MTTANDDLREALKGAGVKVDKDATPAELARLAAEQLSKPKSQNILAGGEPRSREQRLDDLRAAASDQGIGNPTDEVVEELGLVRDPRGGPRYVTSERAEKLVAAQQGVTA